MSQQNKQSRNRSSSDEIPEDVPQYRSVMMAPSMAAPTLPSFSQAAGLRKTVEQVTKQQQQPQHHQAAPTSWTVESTDVPSLPSLYPLERSSVKVDCCAQETADRICECLRKESIAATFDEENKSRLVAETQDCLCFAVHLFTSEEGKIVVELQRRSGCGYLFHQTARAVLRAAKGAPKTLPKRRFTIPSCCPKETLEQKQKCTQEGLDIAFSLMKRNKQDAHILALESLQQITRSSEECSAYAASKILSGQSLEELVALIESSKLGGEAATASPASSAMEVEHQRVMHMHSLAILANCLGALKESGELSSVLLSQSDYLCSKSLLATLVSDLENAAVRPHNACHAARCVQCLSTVDSVREQLLNLNTSDAVMSACDEGACRNAMLESESKKLRLQLNLL